MNVHHAGVAELADAHDSKSCTVRYVGSIPTFGTKIITQAPFRSLFVYISSPVSGGGQVEFISFLIRWLMTP